MLNKSKYISEKKVVYLPYLDYYITTINNKQELPPLPYKWEHKGFIVASKIEIFFTEELRRIIRFVNRKNKKGSAKAIYCSELLESIL